MMDKIQRIQTLFDLLDKVEQGDKEPNVLLDLSERIIQEIFEESSGYLKKFNDIYKDYFKDAEEGEIRLRILFETMLEDVKGQQEKSQVRVPQFDFKFISDEEIKNLLVKDWEEAKKANQNELHKSTVILCGTILESLLINALSCIEDDAKFNYFQKYLEGKKKGKNLPEIEYWKMSELIEIAEQHGIIGPDAVKVSHIVKDYRNSIHLYAHKREQFQVNQQVASIMVELLTITYNRILVWHEKRR